MNITGMILARKSRAVKRYHTHHTIQQQNLADHQWGVAMFAMYLFPDERKEFYLACMTHDIYEKKTGDVPHTAKQDYSYLHQSLANIEMILSDVCNLNIELTNSENIKLKICDILELICFCIEEMKLGSQTMGTIQKNGFEILESLYKAHEAQEGEESNKKLRSNINEFLHVFIP